MVSNFEADDEDEEDLDISVRYRMITTGGDFSDATANDVTADEPGQTQFKYVSMFLCFCVSMFLCFYVSVFLYICVSVFWCFCVSVFLCF